ncbi:MAG: caspase family protein [Pseudomonadota bacterium]
MVGFTTGARRSAARRRVALAGVALLLALGHSSRVWAEQRLALVVGNAGYAANRLANPSNDAELIARALAATGFEVVKLIDADQAALKRAVLELARRLRGSDSVGLFYYAGHAAQVDGENYLIPVGADIKEAAEVPIAAVSLAELLKAMERSESQLTIAILDACRDNPFPSATRSLTRGLAPVKAPTGTLIAFATGPGEVALDGDGANSPYSAALATHIPEIGIPLEEVFRRTRRRVLTATANRQTPWEHSSLTAEFYFRPKTAEPERTARGPLGGVSELRLAELAAWEAIKDSTDIEALRRHVGAYPDGVFAELALIRIGKLERQPTTWGRILTGGVPAAPARSAAESAFERAVKLEAEANGPATLAEAAALYRQAADGGLAAAMHRLGRLYDQGLGVSRDLAEAARWYRRAAELDHAAAMAALGTMHEYGEGVGRDLAEALRLYRLAADRGDPHGLTSLGYLYAEGKGVTRDVAAARRLYATAAELGHTRAMYNLALLCIRGQGGPRDLAEAVRLLGSASDKGHAGAMRELAFLYDEGRGVGRNPVLAAELLLKAFQAGHKEAALDLRSRSQSWSYATRREVQRRLAGGGFYKGLVHGFIDRKTREALDRFAAQN